MRVSLDSCVFLRPFDDQSESRIQRETAAFEAIARQATAGEILLVGSDILDVELDEALNRRPGVDPRPLLQLATAWVRLSPSIARLGQEMAGALGLGIADALHIASAAGNADCFLTSDDEILKEARRIEAFLERKGRRLTVLGPGEFQRWQKRKSPAGT